MIQETMTWRCNKTKGTKQWESSENCSCRAQYVYRMGNAFKWECV